MCKYFNIITQEQLDKIQDERTLVAHGRARPYFYPMEYQIVRMVCIDEVTPAKCSAITGSSIQYIYLCLYKVLDAVPADELGKPYSTRDAMIVRDIASGMKGYKVAEKHGLSGARVSMIYREHAKKTYQHCWKG